MSDCLPVFVPSRLPCLSVFLPACPSASLPACLPASRSLHLSLCPIVFNSVLFADHSGPADYTSHHTRCAQKPIRFGSYLRMLRHEPRRGIFLVPMLFRNIARFCLMLIMILNTSCLTVYGGIREVSATTYVVRRRVTLN